MSGKKNFESSLQELENLVKELEEGSLSLDKSLKKFETGVSLYKACKKDLGEAEIKVKKLMDSLKEESL